MKRFERLRGESPLVVYIDLKSPYAFIAVEPTRAVARAAGVPIEWRPFTLDIPSYLGSARLDRQGRVVESRRSESQWSGVKYAYRDARRYARLAGRVLRGTEKIWDSSLAGIGLLWARRQSPEIVDRYLDDSYRRFWQRALDIEDLAVVAAQLAEAGADVTGFAEFAAGPGRVAHDRINEAAFAAGIYGVPSYLVADEFWFGREHLPRVAWILGGRVGQAPDPGYPVPGEPEQIDAVMALVAPGPGGRLRLRVAVDIRDPQVWLAWRATLALARELAVEVDWLPFEAAPINAPAAESESESESESVRNEDRGTAHRRHRAAQRAREIARYAAARDLALEERDRRADATAAHLGLLWARRSGLRPAEDYLGATLAAWWSGALNPADPDAVRKVLAAAGVPVAGFASWAAGAGPDTLAALRAELQAAGVMQVPTYLAGEEPFQGVGHLPLIRALLVRSQLARG